MVQVAWHDATVKRGRAWASLVAYLCFLAFILLNPSSTIPTTVVAHTAVVLDRLGAPDFLLVGARVEFALNALMFTPIPFLGSWAMPRVRWSEWVAWLFVGSFGVEAFQAIFLAGRSAQFDDVVANTVGGVLGAGLVLLMRRAHAALPFGGVSQ